ncbi:hypothetical protein IDM40_23735 [Nocardiopsis sp. HNM0947]|uniref:Uncharacterized protein n=1 Tax=Nocardiopsis coralli TaxID=2772213 RepID=A0ABR9PCX5_9ACTN|nr:hypothetical protein [Nocardiopsis coralli]MBE3001683.1 hypothetical protein [Nocardiopsis coralli]
MTSPHDNHDEFEAQLRQLLKTEADSVQPSAEGLNLIRERTEKGGAGSWLGLPWLRPAAAVAGAVLIASSVIMSSPQVRDQVLEFVPAGADREESAPVESDGTDDNGQVAAPDTSTDSDDGTTQPESEAPDEPEPEPNPQESPTASDDEDVETASSCPPEDRESPGTKPAEEDEEGPGTRETDEDCEPSDEPSEPDESDEPDPGDEDGEDEDDNDQGSGPEIPENENSGSVS